MIAQKVSRASKRNKTGQNHTPLLQELDCCRFEPKRRFWSAFQFPGTRNKWMYYSKISRRPHILKFAGTIDLKGVCLSYLASTWKKKSRLFPQKFKIWGRRHLSRNCLLCVTNQVSLLRCSWCCGLPSVQVKAIVISTQNEANTFQQYQLFFCVNRTEQSLAWVHQTDSLLYVWSRW